MAGLSVLMSLYIKEKPEYAEACFKSLLAQTVKADEWVVVEDGPLTDELYSLLDRYEKEYPGLIKRVPLPENRGLGLALRAGIPECSNELIARMDTDDIAREDRFEKQLKEFEADPDLDICGSQIDEFEDTPDNIVASRNVPLTDVEIKKYQRRRDAFNHMTVMYKKKAVLDAGNYQSCPLMEDTYLWVRMMKNGVRCKNSGEALVYARIGRDMFNRRGGWAYFKKYKAAFKMVYATGYISWFDYFSVISVQFIVALVPGKLRGWIFKKMLHGKKKS
ncbi:MAG: glycosyltransferase [Lachnospiraceae bacterium]|nr:glycosyltransferase [Lachnospiraceae bacterium]